MILDMLKAFIHGCAIGGVIYLIYVVHELQDKIYDIMNEINKLKKEEKHDT